MLRFVPGEAALILKTRSSKTLVIPDLHLGFEKELAARGINLPSQVDRIFERISKLIKTNNPNSLVFLGDIKHGTGKILPQEWAEIPNFFERLLALIDQIRIIPGNHDGGLNALLPPRVPLESSQGVMLRDDGDLVSLIHGHAWPAPEAFAAKVIVMGHHHFTLTLREPSGLRFVQPVWLVCRWNAGRIAASYLAYRGLKPSADPLAQFERMFGNKIGQPRIVVMPTFNPMLGGMSINMEQHGQHLGPYFRSNHMKLGSSEVYLLDGTFLGRLSGLMQRVTDVQGAA